MTSASPRPAPSEGDTPGSPEDGYALLLTAARQLHENGEETSGVLDVAAALSKRLQLGAFLVPAWGELLLEVRGDRVRVARAVPANINMNRVVGTLQVVEAICDGRLDQKPGQAALAGANRARESNLWLFVAACTWGAGALSVINGATHALVIGIIMACAAASALLRRGLAHLGMSSFLQVFAASLLAGIVGGIGVNAHISSEMRLVALGPLLVMVPGPVILSGALDIAAMRLPLGFARMGFGLLTVFSLSTGLLMGMGLGGATLPASVTTHTVPFWLDVLCAGLASAAYSVFFSMPLRLLPLPVLAGMLAHGLHWWLISGLGQSNATGAGAACLLVGVLVLPLARRMHLPFSGVGFASVVAMVPGTFLFRMSGGLMQIQKHPATASPLLLNGAVSDGLTALLTVFAMTLGLVLPLGIYAHFNAHKAVKGT